MKQYNNRYRGLIISIKEVDENNAEYQILKLDKTLVEDTEGYCVTVSEAMDICKEVIDDLIEGGGN